MELNTSFSFEQGMKRLGWVNAFTRQVTIARHLLRQMAEIDDIGDLLLRNREAYLLDVFRVSISIFSEVNKDKKRFSSSYTPEHSPNTHFLKYWRSRPIFSVSCAAGAPETKFFETAESSTAFDHGDYDALEDQLLVHEIYEVSKGTSLFNVGIADNRSASLKSKPLWRGFASIEEKRSKENLERLASRKPAVWSFWREWYQGFLDGKPLDWELQRRVALIPDEDWQKGPEHIARKIEEIKAGWLAEQAPSAEKIEFDEGTQKFHVIPLEIAKPDLLGATLSQIEDALDDVLACPSNGLHDGSKAVRVLRRTLTKYGNNPQQIEMGLVTAHTAITRQFLADEMPQSEENLALRDAIENGARGIRATHPEVAENRKILKDQALREMSQEDLDLLEDAKPMLEAWSSDDLAEDWAHDIPQLINDATTPLPSGAPPLPGAEEATRIFSRAAKMKLSYDAIVSNGASAFDSKTMKTVRLGLTFSGLLSALVGMGLRLFGLI